MPKPLAHRLYESELQQKTAELHSIFSRECHLIDTDQLKNWSKIQIRHRTGNFQSRRRRGLEKSLFFQRFWKMLMTCFVIIFLIFEGDRSMSRREVTSPSIPWLLALHISPIAHWGQFRRDFKPKKIRIEKHSPRVDAMFNNLVPMANTQLWYEIG